MIVNQAERQGLLQVLMTYRPRGGTDGILTTIQLAESVANGIELNLEQCELLHTIIVEMLGSTGQDGRAALTVGQSVPIVRVAGQLGQHFADLKKPNEEKTNGHLEIVERAAAEA